MKPSLVGSKSPRKEHGGQAGDCASRLESGPRVYSKGTLTPTPLMKWGQHPMVSCRDTRHGVTRSSNLFKRSQKQWFLYKNFPFFKFGSENFKNLNTIYRSLVSGLRFTNLLKKKEQLWVGGWRESWKPVIWFSSMLLLMILCMPICFCENCTLFSPINDENNLTSHISLK